MSAGHKELAEKKAVKGLSKMPVIVRNTPPGYSWGWYAREEPRMHLQTVGDQHGNQYKVWLEARGHRICEAANKIPSKVFKAIETAVAKNRMTIEDRWVRFAILHGWMQAHLAAPGDPYVIVTVYPHTPNSFTRTIDLTQDLLPKYIQALRPEDITLSAEMASLQLWPSLPEDRRLDIRLSRELWEG